MNADWLTVPPHCRRVVVALLRDEAAILVRGSVIIEDPKVRARLAEEVIALRVAADKLERDGGS